MPQLYLASKSPRRREILASMGLTDIALLVQGPEQLTAFVGDEVQHMGELPEDYVVRIAKEKALQAIARIESENLPKAPVLAADTAVILKGEILGKPADIEEARSFMTRLSGQTHEVRTAVALGTTAENLEVSVSVSRVHFAVLEPDQIEDYIRTQEPYDKAGGYGIQGLAGLFIDSIQGSYSGIMGLPVFETGMLLKKYGLTAI